MEEKKLISDNMFVDEANKIMIGIQEGGASIGLHKHEKNSEIIYFLKGKDKVLYDGEYKAVKEGQCHY